MLAVTIPANCRKLVCTIEGVAAVSGQDVWAVGSATTDGASGPIAAGCDVVTVQRALGHAKATTTLNTYAHLWPTAEDRTRAATDGLMSAALDFSADFLRTSRR